jgi:putative hydrolase of the HAD superfamily
MLGELRRKGFKLALVSNSGRPLVLKILAAIGLGTEMFDAVVTSSDADPKPSHASFKLAMASLGCTPGHAVYVGDRIDSELRPAHELGITTILVAPGTNDQSSQNVDIALEDVTELPEVIRKDIR